MVGAIRGTNVGTHTARMSLGSLNLTIFLSKNNKNWTAFYVNVGRGLNFKQIAIVDDDLGNPRMIPFRKHNCAS